jgi:hypothetical protein
MFTDVSEVLVLCITTNVKKAKSNSETSVYIYRLHSGTSQKAAIFIYVIIGLEMRKF